MLKLQLSYLTVYGVRLSLLYMGFLFGVLQYDTRFADAFWNSSKQNLLRHFLNILSSWALVADVWYLPPETQWVGFLRSTHVTVLNLFLIFNCAHVQLCSTVVNLFLNCTQLCSSSSQLYSTCFRTVFNSSSTELKFNGAQLFP